MKSSIRNMYRTLYSHVFKAATTAFMLILPTICVYGQTSFALTEDHGHYFFYATVNGHEDTRLFMESGVPGILINEADYERILADAQLEKVDKGYSKIRFLSGTHHVKQIYKGKVTIGGLSYNGKIYVIDKQDKICIPMHRLKNETDTAAYMERLNFKEKTIDFITPDDIDVTKMHRFRLGRYKENPAIIAKLGIADTYGNKRTIVGKFIFDLGNASALYLLESTTETSLFLKQGKFRIFPAKDKSGRKIADGILADVCRIGNISKRNVSIGIISQSNTKDIIGLVGTKMFEDGYAIIDLKNRCLYYGEEQHPIALRDTMRLKLNRRITSRKAAQTPPLKMPKGKAEEPWVGGLLKDIVFH